MFGSKGKNIRDMHRVGLPVPDAFIITSLTCKEYLEGLSYNEDRKPSPVHATPSQKLLRQELQEQLKADYWKAIHIIEAESKTSFGVSTTSVESVLFPGLADCLPLLFSVRASFSDEEESPSIIARGTLAGSAHAIFNSSPSTVLNIGMNDDVLQQMIRLTRNERWANDCYRRFLQVSNQLYIVCSFRSVLMGKELVAFNIEQWMMHSSYIFFFYVMRAASFQ
jgi:phosphoenolpyruvate synthase/pyruvate phosphate dikinase